VYNGQDMATSAIKCETTNNVFAQGLQKANSARSTSSCRKETVV
jgi:hypothetical protein